jgi:hypothetical protein
MITLQSFSHVSPLYQEEDESGLDNLGAAQASAAATGSSGGGLLGGIGANAGSAISTVGVASRTVVNGQSNAALMSMPSVVAADQQTTANLENSFGFSGQQQLFKTGRGDLVSATGSRQSVDVFSRMSNDSVLTSRNKNFEVSSGAQMQLLVGVEKR